MNSLSGFIQQPEFASTVKDGTPYVDVRTVDYQDGERANNVSNSNHAELVIELTSISKFCSKVLRSPMEY
jgi:hypothetical protein